MGMEEVDIDLKSVDGLETTTISADVTAIKAKTDNLPSDPADASVVAGQITTAETNIRGADNDTLKTLSDQIDGIGGGSSSSEAKATYTYLDAGAEQTIYEQVSTTRRLISGFWLDLSTITQTGVIKAYYKVDGVNYRLASTFPFDPMADSPAFFANVQFSATDDFKITYTENVDEGADRDIPYVLISMDI